MKIRFRKSKHFYSLKEMIIDDDVVCIGGQFMRTDKNGTIIALHAIQKEFMEQKNFSSSLSWEIAKDIFKQVDLFKKYESIDMKLFDIDQQYAYYCFDKIKGNKNKYDINMKIADDIFFSGSSWWDTIECWLAAIHIYPLNASIEKIERFYKFWNATNKGAIDEIQCHL